MTCAPGGALRVAAVFLQFNRSTLQVVRDAEAAGATTPDAIKR
jgi:hypothetical protein